MTGEDEADAALRRIDEQVREAQDRTEEVGRWAQDVQEVTGTGSSPDRGATARVDVGGTLVGLSVGDVLAGRGGRAVAASVLQAVAAAQTDVRAQVERSTAAMFGAGSETTRTVVAEVAADNPGRPPEPPAPGPTPGGTW